MKKNMCLIVMAVLVSVSSLTFVTGTFADDQVDVQVGQDIDVSTFVVTGGDGDENAYMGSAYMGVPLNGNTPTPDIPLTKGDHWRHESINSLVISHPGTVTPKMLDTYYDTKISFEEDPNERRKMAKAIEQARRELLREANFGIYFRFKPTTEIHISGVYPNAYAIKGTDYIAMGGTTFQTQQELVGFWGDLFGKKTKTSKVSSADLLAMVEEIGMKLGADVYVLTGSGAQAFFSTRANSLNGGALVAGALAVSTANALPLGGAFATGGGGTSGSNVVTANPFLRVAYIKVKNEKKVLIALGQMKAPEKIVATVPVAKTLKKDNYLTLAMCAKPVQTPNGVTRLQVAEEELAKYIASGNNDLEALSVFQSHMAQGIRDNIKGENLKMAQKGIVLAWIERSHVIKRAFEAQLINKAEFTKAHADNISQAIKAMEKYQLATVPDIGVYAPMLKMHNSTYSAVK